MSFRYVAGTVTGGVSKAVCSLVTAVCTQVTVTDFDETRFARSTPDVADQFGNSLTAETRQNVLVYLNLGVFVVSRVSQAGFQ